jgi:hypothetical protein
MNYPNLGCGPSTGDASRCGPATAVLRSHRRFGRSENTELSNNPRIGFSSGCIATDAARHLAAHRESSELDGSSRSNFECEMRGANQQVHM